MRCAFRAADVPKVVQGDGTQAALEVALKQHDDFEAIAVVTKEDEFVGAVLRSHARFLCALSQLAGMLVSQVPNALSRVDLFCFCNISYLVMSGANVLASQATWLP